MMKKKNSDLKAETPDQIINVFQFDDDNNAYYLSNKNGYVDDYILVRDYNDLIEKLRADGKIPNGKMTRIKIFKIEIFGLLIVENEGNFEAEDLNVNFSGRIFLQHEIDVGGKQSNFHQLTRKYHRSDIMQNQVTYTQIVDSGQILICDPCYLERFFDNREEFLKFYKRICGIEGEIKNEYGIVDMMKIQCDDGEYRITVNEV